MSPARLELLAYLAAGVLALLALRRLAAAMTDANATKAAAQPQQVWSVYVDRKP